VINDNGESVNKSANRGLKMYPDKEEEIERIELASKWSEWGRWGKTSLT